jgi:hypothetical protein
VSDDRIFVQIPSYRDPECQHTVADLFAQAARPDRVSVGVCWQRVPEEDAHCFAVTTRPDQVRVAWFHADDSRGACWARSQCQALWAGEPYTLQIDSHMRFEPGWDETLLAMLAACPSERPVLSAYPATYTPPRTLVRDRIFAMRAKRFDYWGVLRISAPPIPLRDAPAAPMAGGFVASGFLFAPSAIIEQVPYDPHLYFFGEEVTLGARLWTHGWDIFHPNALVTYHLWERKGRPTHYDDHDDANALNHRARARVRHLLGTERSSDPEVLVEVERYGLGRERSLAEYQRWCGVDFAARTIGRPAYPTPG